MTLGHTTCGSGAPPNVIEIGPPFSLELTLRFDQGHRWRPDQQYTGWYTSVLDRDFVRIRQATENGPLEFEAGNGQEAMETVERVADKLRCQFRADENTGAVYLELKKDSRMAALVNRYYGLRLMRVDPWECLVFFVLSAHNHTQSHNATSPTARAMDEIARWFWQEKQSKKSEQSWPRSRYPFPGPQELASQDGLYKLNHLWLERAAGPAEGDLAPATLGGLRSMPGRIPEAAQFVADGGLEELSGMRTDQAIFNLELLPGVGAKTAQCVALFGLGCLDAFPVDAHVLRALLSLYGRDPFQPYAGYASQFLFMEGLTNSPVQ